MGDQPTKKEDSTTFTVDPGASSSDMPSVTKLLNRKSLSLKNKTQTPPRPPLPPQHPPFKESLTSLSPSPPPSPLSQEEQDAPTQVFQTKPTLESTSEIQMSLSASEAPQPASASSNSPHEISLSLESSSPQFQLETSSPPPPLEVQLSPEIVSTPRETSISLRSDPAPILELAPDIQAELIAAPSLSPTPTRPPPKIQRTARKPERGVQRLILWELASLKNGMDPLAKGISNLFQKGATQSLFLGITTPPAGSPVPHFLSTAAVQPQEKLAIWTGLKWDPKVVPEMWNFFIKSGLVELPPPGSHTNLSSNRNVVRAAFGILPNEWLLMIRVGPPTACRGVIAFVSKKSLLTELGEAVPLLSSPIPDQAA